MQNRNCQLAFTVCETNKNKSTMEECQIFSKICAPKMSQNNQTMAVISPAMYPLNDFKELFNAYCFYSLRIMGACEVMFSVCA